MEYGIFLLDTAYQKDIKLLNSIQYKALRIISGINGHVSLQILQTELQDQPWKIRQHILAMKYIVKPLQLIRHPLIPKLKLLYKIYNPYYLNKQHRYPALIEAFVYFQDKSFLQFQNFPIYINTYNAISFQPTVVDTYDTKQLLYEGKQTVIDELQKRKAINTIYNYIYTDGSKQKETDVGAAVYDVNNLQKLTAKLPGDTSIYSAELSLYIY